MLSVPFAFLTLYTPVSPFPRSRNLTKFSFHKNSFLQIIWKENLRGRIDVEGLKLNHINVRCKPGPPQLTSCVQIYKWRYTTNIISPNAKRFWAAWKYSFLIHFLPQPFSILVFFQKFLRKFCLLLSIFDDNPGGGEMKQLRKTFTSWLPSGSFLCWHLLHLKYLWGDFQLSRLFLLIQLYT